MFVKLEKVAEEITDEEFNKVFEKSAEYKYFGKLKLVNQEELKKHFKEARGNSGAISCYIWQLGYADGLLTEVIGTQKTDESKTVSYNFAKRLGAEKIRNGLMDAYEEWEGRDE